MSIFWLYYPGFQLDRCLPLPSSMLNQVDANLRTYHYLKFCLLTHRMEIIKKKKKHLKTKLNWTNLFQSHWDFYQKKQLLPADVFLLKNRHCSFMQCRTAPLPNDHRLPQSLTPYSYQLTGGERRSQKMEVGGRKQGFWENKHKSCFLALVS